MAKRFFFNETTNNIVESTNGSQENMVWEILPFIKALILCGKYLNKVFSLITL